MKILYILSFLIILLLFTAPVAGSLNKIAPDAPVFVGESDVDISAGLNGCHSIAWWQEGKDITTDPPGKNLTISEINTVSPRIFHFNFTPDFFSGYTGTWYCQDKQPYYPVFEVRDPQINISIVDSDTGTDITGQSVPYGTKLTYQIDTNMYPALQYGNRPNYNPGDSFFTVTITDPRGRSIPNYYTGSAGNPKTIIIPLDNHPLVTTSTYLEPNMPSWDQSARNSQGDQMYPPGTYTVTLTQNLNNMQIFYSGRPLSELEGTLVKSASFTLFRPVTSTPTPTATPVVTLTTNPGTQQTTRISAAPSLPVTVTTPTKKVTYSPLPTGLVLTGILIAGIFMIRRTSRKP